MLMNLDNTKYPSIQLHLMSERRAHTENFPSPFIVVFHPYTITWEQLSLHNNIKSKVKNLEIRKYIMYFIYNRSTFIKL